MRPIRRPSGLKLAAETLESCLQGFEGKTGPLKCTRESPWGWWAATL